MKYLIDNKYSSKGKIIGMGGSAGGLLMGVVVNQAPELFLGIIMAVPFVDSLTTNLDHSLPLTVGEFDEFGNAKENKEHFDYIFSYALPDKDLLAKEVKELDLYDDTHIENDEKIKYLSRLEASASSDKKIVNTESSFTEDKSNFILANSDGFCKGFKTSSFVASSVAVAKDDKSMERDYEYTLKCHLNDIKSAEEFQVIRF